MASNVFGDPVTDDIVRHYFPDLANVTAKDRATVAMMYLDEAEGVMNVSNFVDNLQSAYAGAISTRCMVFNATGGDLTFAFNHPWEGKVWPSPYPFVIQNGQWGGFLHVPGGYKDRSKEAVVYSGKNNDGIDCDWMLAWHTAPLDHKNRVYTEIREQGHYQTDHWHYIDSLMENHDYFAKDIWNGCKSIIFTSESVLPELQAIMTLENVKIPRDDNAITQPA